MLRSSTVILTAATLSLTTHTAQADILAQFAFNSDLSATTVHDDLDTVSAINPELNNTNASVTGGEWAIPHNATGSTSTNYVLDFDDGPYFEFTVTPDSNAVMDFTSLTYLIDTTSGATRQINAAVRTSLDSFGSTVGTNQQSGSSVTDELITFTLESMPTVDEVITFRVYLAGDSGTSATFELDDITLNGSVIPEPASLALMGLGGLMMCGRRRRA